MGREVYKRTLNKLLYQDDLYGFCGDVLGYTDMNGIHKDLCSFLVRKGHFKLILMPRYTFKSCICTIGNSLRRLVKNVNLRILIYSDATSKAEGFLTGITNHILGKQGSSSFREKFGAWEVNAKEDRWNLGQIVIKPRNEGASEPSIETAGIETSLTGRHYDLIIFDDIVSDKNVTSRDQMDKVAECYGKALSLLRPGGDVIMVGCLVAGSNVSMADGSLKPIEMVKVGDSVYSHDSIQTVEAMIPQGAAKVYELKTRNHTIQATGNHPFLTKDGFKKLEDLKPKDKIYSLGYTTTDSRSIYSEDEMWLLGYMFGDGWITHHPNSKGSMRWVTCIAKGEYEELNRKATGILEGKFDFKFKETKFGYYRTEVARVGKYLEGLGFKGKAKTKRIPKYIYSLPDKLRESFLCGFTDADGYCGEIRHIEISNRELVRDLKQLFEITGYKVSNIYHRTRISQAPNSPKPIVAHSYHISIGNKKSKNKFRLETISSIEVIGEKEVYDLTVSNTHNFIAEGLVVHNTRWHFGDLYGRLIAEGTFDTFITGAEKNGELLFDNIGESSLTREFLDRQKAQQGGYVFSCLYMNSPVDPETAIFRQEDFSFYGDIKPDDLYVTCMCDPAGEGKDYTGITVVGTDSDMSMHILDARQGHWNPTQIIDEIIRLNYKYRFTVFGLETIFFRKMLRNELNRRIEEERRKNPSFFNLFGIREFDSASRHGKSKFARIMALQPYHERGALKFPGEKYELLKGGFAELANQMAQFTPTHMPEPNDLLDSLADHVEHISRGGVVKKADIPKGTPAWCERYEYEKELTLRRHIPRRFRRDIAELTFS